MLEINDLLRDSLKMKNENWKTQKARFVVGHKNPLEATYLSIARIFDVKSKETLAREAQRKANTRQPEPSTATQPPAQNTNVPPTVFATPKRRTTSAMSAMSDISELSYGDTSQHTTPEKYKGSETTVQSLQDSFVQDVIKAVFLGGRIPVHWVTARTIQIGYEPYTTFTILR